MASGPVIKRRGRIFFSLLLLLFGVGVVPLVGTSYQLLSRSREILELDQKAMQLDTGRSLSQQVGTYLKSLVAQVAAVARTLEVDVAPGQFAARVVRIREQNALTGYVEGSSPFYYISVVDVRGLGARSGVQFPEAAIQQLLEEGYRSLIMRPPVSTGEAPQVNLLAAVAVADAIAEMGGFAPSIKLPNDVLVKGKKVCGILAEMQTETGALRSLVLGIGVNINAPLSAFPPELHDKGSSLLLIGGQSIDRAAFTAALLTHLEKWCVLWIEKGFPALRSAWERYAADLIGKPISVAAPEGTIEGTVLGLDTDGAFYQIAKRAEDRRDPYSVIWFYRRYLESR